MRRQHLLTAWALLGLLTLLALVLVYYLVVVPILVGVRFMWMLAAFLAAFVADTRDAWPRQTLDDRPLRYPWTKVRP